MKRNTKIFIVLILAIVGCSASAHRSAAIRDRLADTSGLAAHDISIEERPAGIITLSGNVSSDEDRRTIESVARHTRGVREVRNNLIVDRSYVVIREDAPSSVATNRSVVSRIVSEMSAAPELRNYNINVDVVDNAVTLRGDVSDENERATAERIARNTRGVTSVRNDIIVTRIAPHDARLSEEVRDVLAQGADVDLRDVRITARDSIVTLRGSQPSDRAIDTLVSHARSVPGVRDVRNELTLDDSQNRRYR